MLPPRCPPQVGDPFTAVALKGLFEALVAEGCVVVATSNRAPSELDRQAKALVLSSPQQSLGRWLRQDCHQAPPIPLLC